MSLWARTKQLPNTVVGKLKDQTEFHNEASRHDLLLVGAGAAATTAAAVEAALYFFYQSSLSSVSESVEPCAINVHPGIYTAMYILCTCTSCNWML